MEWSIRLLNGEMCVVIFIPNVRDFYYPIPREIGDVKEITLHRTFDKLCSMHSESQHAFNSSKSIRSIPHLSIVPADVPNNIPLDRPTADVNVNPLGFLTDGGSVQLVKIFPACNGERANQSSSICPVSEVSFL